MPYSFQNLSKHELLKKCKVNDAAHQLSFLAEKSPEAQKVSEKPSENNLLTCEQTNDSSLRPFGITNHQALLRTSMNSNQTEVSNLSQKALKSHYVYPPFYYPQAPYTMFFQPRSYMDNQFLTASQFYNPMPISQNNQLSMPLFNGSPPVQTRVVERKGHKITKKKPDLGCQTQRKPKVRSIFRNFRGLSHLLKDSEQSLDKSSNQRSNN